MRFSCGMCEFFQANPEVRIVGAPDNVSVMAGECTVNPPIVHLIPVQMAPRSIVDVKADGSQRHGIQPQAFDPVVLNTRHACEKFCPRIDDGAQRSPGALDKGAH